MPRSTRKPEAPRGYTPPANLEAEQSVLGAILVRPECLDELIDQVYEEDFYREAHGRIYHAMLDLHGANFPVDLVSVCAYLKDRGQLEVVGGPVFLAGLSEAVGFATNAIYYAKIIREKAILRRLLDASQEIAAACLAPVENIEEFVGQAEIKISGAMEDRGTREYSLAELLPEETRRIEILHEHRDQILGVPSGFRDLDNLTAGFQKSDLIILAARPGMGKTSLALNIAHYAATVAENFVPVAFFSLEMSKEQLVRKLISSEGRINGDRLRTGRMTGEEWAKMYAIQGLLESTPIYIRDDASPTVLQIKAQARRMKKKYGIGLVVVDYLQLMRDPRERVREQQIARISGDLKAMAKELDVPVLALSQLNRELEKRPNRRPKLSDLRECLVGDSLVYDAQTGEFTPLSHTPVKTVGLDGYTNLAISPTQITETWPTGIKPVFRVRTATGRVLRCTANHPLLTIDGWCPLEQILEGTRIAVPRQLPKPQASTNPLMQDELRLIGYLISDGHYGKHRTVEYVKGDPFLVADVRKIAKIVFGIRAKKHDCQGLAETIMLTGNGGGPGSNPLINWLKALGIYGQIGPDKRVPKDVWLCDNRLLAVFLGALWAGDGSVLKNKTGHWYTKFTSTSMGLLEDIQNILLRLGIISVLSNPGRNSKSTMDIATITVRGQEPLSRFIKFVPVPGEKGKKLKLAAKELKKRGRNSRIDRLPLSVTERVAEQAKALRFSWKEIGYRCQGKEMCREDLLNVAERFGDEGLRRLANSDVLWDKIESITPDGEEEVFDFRAPTTANINASGFFVHNSGALEQDADVVIFVYRDEMYRKDSLDKGIAEVDVAKQRKGPTGLVKLAYLSQFTLFQNYYPPSGGGQ